MIKSIKSVIMARDDLTESEADDLIAQAQEAFDYYVSNSDLDSAQNVCMEFFGLEPDYLDEFMF